jgi:beta-lactam-binding protein with PASTA domain/predicted Ser/Thr protein kinase
MSEQGPTVFKDRYEVHRKLARGGMSDVYLARDRVLDRPVALKVLFPEYAKDATFVARFRREAQAAARLNHPNIVGVYDWGEETGTYFIAMEYIEGHTLSEIVRAEGPMHPRRAAEVAADVAAALGFAHRNGVIHRDVKPGNVMVETSGLVKVADFGIAQAVGGPEQTQLTRVGSVMGTATYFSPEQAQGRQVDPRSDLYSLGCVLFEVLTGRPPFTGDSPVAIAYKHVQEAPPRPSSVAQVPAPLDAIVMKCLGKNPDERYATADDLRGDLRRYLDGQPVAALAAAGAAGAAAAAALGGAAAADATAAWPGSATGATTAYGTPYGTGSDATTAMPAGYGYPGAPGDGTGAAPIPYGPDDENAPKKTSPWLIGALVAFLVLVAIALIALAANLAGSGGQKAAVPAVDLGRDTYEVAKAKVEAGGRFKAVRREAENEKYDAGIVFEQSPEGGTEAEVGSEVFLTVSKGSGTKVPDVSNKQESAARADLNKAGFTDVQSTPQASDTILPGIVITTDPPPGTTQPKTARVTLIVSSGKGAVTVPDVSGTPTAQARQRLQADGFTIISSEKEYSDRPPGVVNRTDPPAGSSADPKNEIVIYESQGPRPTTTTTTAPTTTTTTASTSTSRTTTSRTLTTNGGGIGNRKSD